MRSPRSGATLVELVVVLTITSVLAGGMAGFLTKPLEAYQDLSRRAALVDAAEGALRRIARDVPYEVAREVELHPYRNPAFRIEAVPTRRTPGGRAFVHIIGRVQQVEQGVSSWLKLHLVAWVPWLLIHT